MRKESIYLMIIILLMSACASTNRETTTTTPNQPVANSPTPTPTSTATKPPVGSDPETTNQDENFEGVSGIMEKQFNNRATATLKEIRAAQYSNYDRIVFDFHQAELPSYHIEYIDKPVRSCGSGEVVKLAGDGWLSIKFTPAQAHDEQGNATISFREKQFDFKVIKEVKSICDFEADVNWVLGVAAPNKYRVLEFSNPTRLVVDIKHSNKKKS